MIKLEPAAIGAGPQSIESCRRQCEFQNLSWRQLAAASAAVLLISGCVPDMRGSEVSQPHYSNPLEELDIASLDDAMRPAEPVASDLPGTRFIQARPSRDGPGSTRRRWPRPTGSCRTRRFILDSLSKSLRRRRRQ